MPTESMIQISGLSFHSGTSQNLVTSEHENVKYNFRWSFFFFFMPVPPILEDETKEEYLVVDKNITFIYI